MAKKITDALKGQVWGILDKDGKIEKAFILYEVELWERKDHKDKDSHELLDAIEKGEKDSTLVCYSGNFSRRYLYIFTCEDNIGRDPYGFKINKARVVDWNILSSTDEDKILKGILGPILTKTTEICNALGYNKGGRKVDTVNSRVKYIMNVADRL